MKKIGVIGLGNMGSAVARNVQRANFPLYIYDIKKETGTKLISNGAIWKNTMSMRPAWNLQVRNVDICTKTLINGVPQQEKKDIK